MAASANLNVRNRRNYLTTGIISVSLLDLTSETIYPVAAYGRENLAGKQGTGRGNNMQVIYHSRHLSRPSAADLERRAEKANLTRRANRFGGKMRLCQIQNL